MAKYAYHQIDGNQRIIMDYLQAHGFSVTSIGRPLDLLAGKVEHPSGAHGDLPRRATSPSDRQWEEAQAQLQAEIERERYESLTGKPYWMR